MTIDKFGFGYDIYRRLRKYKATCLDFFLYRDLKCIKVYRKANYYYLNNKKYLFKYWQYKLKKMLNKFDFNIPATTKIGKGFFIGHNGPIIINKDAIIGNNCNISTGVTIGRENRGEREGSPILGDRVWVGTNAVIVGKIKIGNNVLIAPNSFVNFDVPDNSIVVGNPARIVSNKNATFQYIDNLIEVEL